MKRIAPVLKCSLIALALTGCTPEAQVTAQDAAAVDNVETVETAPATQAQVISVQQPWVRQPPLSARVAAGYLRLENSGAEADRLLAVDTADAARVEIHEMEEVDGVMRMREVQGGLEVPAAGHVELAPGGYHLMLMEPREGLVAGDQLEATLVFERAGEVPVVFSVRPVDGSAESDGHAHGDDHGDGHGH